MHTVGLFNNFSKSTFSKAFTVFPASVAVLSAFNLGYKVSPTGGEPKNSQQKFIIQKLTFEGGRIFSEEDFDCCIDYADIDRLGFDPIYEYVEDVTQCGVWNLNACQNVGVITLPGTYRIELNDELALGTAVLNLTRYRLEEVGHVPRSLIFGE